MWEKFLENGQIDAFDPIFKSLPELFISFGVDAIMWVFILFLLFFNKYTRWFTVGSAILFILFGG